MPREEFEVDLTANNELSDEARDAAKALDAIPTEVEARLEVEASGVDKAIGKLDELAQEAASSAIAAEALGQALGPELSARADMRSVIAELEKLGVTADEVTADVERVAAKLREVDSADLGGGLGQALGTARGETEKLADSARGANSALANVVGNSAQELGALGGVVGPLGLAFGQMGEYAADASLGGEKLGSALASMAKVLGPVLAITAALSAVTGAMEASKKRAEEAAANTERFGEAMAQAADDGVGLADSLRDMSGSLEDFDASASLLGGFGTALNDAGKAVPLLGRLFQDTGVDIVQALTDSGNSIYEFAAAIEDSAAGAAFVEELGYLRDAGLITSEQFAALEQAVGEYGDQAAAAADKQRIFNVSAEEANAVLGELAAQADPLARMGDTWQTLFDDMADGSIDTRAAADAINELAAGLGKTQEEVIGLAQQKLDEDMQATADASDEAAQRMSDLAAAAQEYQAIVASADWGAATIAGAAAGAERFAEAQFGLTNIASEAEAAYDSLNAAIEANGFTFDLNSEAGRANAAVVQDLYSSQIPSMAAAFANADGSISTFRSSMDDLRANVMQQLREETSLTEEQIVSIVDQMGFVPGNVSTQFEMLGLDAANEKLGLLSGVMSSLPPDVQRQVTLAIIAGDPQAALDTIEASLSGAPLPPAVVPVDVDTGVAEDDRDRFVDDTEAATPTVDVDANTKEALGTIILLKLFATLLQPVVTVTANTRPAEDAITQAARPRSTVVAVGTSGLTEVDRALTNVARDRNAVINVTTNQTTVLRRVDGGG